jgi:hypothetical protein
VDEVAVEQVFLGVLLLFPANHHPTIAPYSSVTAPRGVRYPCPRRIIIPSVLSCGLRLDSALVWSRSRGSLGI